MRVFGRCGEGRKRRWIFWSWEDVKEEDMLEL